MTIQTPIANAYWVQPGKILAGEYPAFVGVDEAAQRLEALLGAGVTLFLDLTQEYEHHVPPYAALLAEIAEQRKQRVQHVRMGIRDMNAPTVDFMHEIQRTLEIALEQGETVYIHCMGGIGRTGTVVGCYLVENGRTGEQAIEEIATLRQGIPSAKHKSPETSAQRALIINWRVEGIERQAAR